VVAEGLSSAMTQTEELAPRGGWIWRVGADGVNLGPWVVFVLGVLLYEAAPAMFVHLIRVAVFDRIGDVDKILNGTILAVATLPLLYCGYHGPLTFLFVTMLLYGLVMGTLQGQEFGFAFVGQVYHWSIMFVGFSLGHGVDLGSERLRRLLTHASYAILIVSLIGFGALEYFRTSTGTSLYVGYPGGPLVLPLAVFLTQGRWAAALVSLIVLVATGKRGPLLAVVFAAIFLLLLRRLRRFGTALLGSVSVAVVAAVLLVGVLTTSGHQSLGSDTIDARILWKWRETLKIGDLTRASSGRDLEVAAAMRLVESRLGLLWGRGYGWSFGEGADVQHYVHVSYVNYLVTYGAFLASIFVLFLFDAVRRASGAVLVGGRDAIILRILLFYLVATLLEAATTSLFSISLTFWILLGVTWRLSAKTLEGRAEWRPAGARLGAGLAARA
jgi:hypothetical protein